MAVIGYARRLRDPEDVYDPLVDLAGETGLTPEELAAQWLMNTVRQVIVERAEQVNGSAPLPSLARPQIHPEIYKLLEMTAERRGRPVEELADEWRRQFTPKPRPQLTEEEKKAAMERLLKHAGAADLGYATGADNESIDADLAREYGSSHEEEN